MLNVFKRTARIFTCLVLMLVPAFSFANMDAAMGAMFTNLSNVTPPSIYETQQRNMVSFGSVYHRYTPKVTFSLVKATPPSFSQSCGSMDLHLGALSVMKGDQIVKTLRAVAASATSYFFELALNAMCKDCLEGMKKAAAEINKWSKIAADGCKLGEAAFNLLDGKPDKAYDSLGAGLMVGGAKITDLASAWSGDGSAGSPRAMAVKAGYRDKIVGNAIWSVLQKSNLPGWYSFMAAADQNMFKVQMMNLYGTFVTNSEDDPDDIQAPPQVKTTQFAGNILKLEDLVKGTTAAALIDCKDGYERCIDPTGTTTQPIVGSAPAFLKLLLGDGVGNQGVVGALLARRAYGGDPLTDEQRAVLAILPGDSALLLARIAKNKGSVYSYSNVVAETVGVQAVYGLVTSINKMLRLALINLNPADEIYAAEIRKQIRVVEQDLENLKNKAINDLKSHTEIGKLGDMYRRQLMAH